jgi:hypothetical protein
MSMAIVLASRMQAERERHFVCHSQDYLCMRLVLNTLQDTELALIPSCKSMLWDRRQHF